MTGKTLPPPAVRTGREKANYWPDADSLTTIKEAIFPNHGELVQDNW